MRKINWKMALSTIFATLLFTILVYNLYLFEYVKIEVEQTYIKVYVCTTIFHFLLAHELLKKHGASPLLFLLCIAPHLVIDTQVLIEDVLVPLRAPFATIFPILGTTLAFLYEKKKKGWFSISVIASIAFLFVSELVLIPKMEYMNFTRKLPKTTGILKKQTFVGINGKRTTIEDTAKNKVKLIEWYFVGCAPCEEKNTWL